MALEILGSPHKLAEASEKAREARYAPNTVSGRLAKIVTWDKFVAKLTPVPKAMSVHIIQQVTAAMRAAGYRSTDSYVGLALQRWKKDHPRDNGEDLNAERKEVRREDQRGLGPPKQTDTVDFEEWITLPDDWDMAQDAPLGQRRLSVISAWWMLRESEISRLDITAATIPRDGLAGIYFDVQKRDFVGTGEARFLSCICHVAEELRACPACTLIQHKQEVKAFFFGDSTRPDHRCSGYPLFPSLAGQRMKQVAMVRLVESGATALGFSLFRANRARRFGRHFWRHQGVAWLASRGVTKLRLMDLGRWSSPSIDRYLKLAALKRISDISTSVAQDWAGPPVGMVQSDISLIGATVPPAPKQNIDLEQLELAITGVVEMALANFVKAREAAELEAPRVVAALDYVINTKDFGKAHRVLVGELRPTRCWVTKCGWRFGWPTAASRRSTTSDGAAPCDRCFAVSVGA